MLEMSDIVLLITDIRHPVRTLERFAGRDSVGVLKGRNRKTEGSSL